MKYIRLLTAIILAGVLLAGCGILHIGAMHHQVSCYYLRDTFTYEGAESILLAEHKEAAGHDSDLQYLMHMYLQGPVSAGLVSPFPSGTKLLDVEAVDQTLVVSLSRDFLQLENADLTMAGACLVKTAQNFADVDSVRIICVGRDGEPVELTFRASDFQFYD